MLAAGAAERYLQMAEVAFDIACYVVIDKGIDRLQKSQYLAVLNEEVDYRLIHAGQLLVLVVLTRVMGRTAVEYIATAITRIVLGDAALKTETIYGY